jgi:trigger factor
MHIELENLPNCVTTLRVELPPDRVSQEKQSILREFQGSARLPGYRPGKAPRHLIETRYKKEIAEELRRKLVNAGTREAIAEKKLRVLSVGDVEQVELAPDSTLRFTAKLITAPEFELPPYQGLPVKVPPVEITEEELDKALDGLRHRLADFNDIEGRGLEMGDFAVLDFAGRLDGQPLSEVAPEAPKEFTGRENFWFKLAPNSLLPGFSEALVGAMAGETRELGLEIPPDFPLEALIGKRVEYTVKVRELKQQVLPELDDAFAEKVMPGKTLADLRARGRADLEAERLGMIEESKRRQITAQLVGATHFDLPVEFVRSETRRIMSDIVRQNQERGISDDEIRGNHGEIGANAANAARERLTSAFILTRIAEKEGIKVTREEFDRHLAQMAVRHQMALEKLRRLLEERQALGQIEEEVLIGKVLAFIVANASVETVAATSFEAPEAAIPEAAE